MALKYKNTVRLEPRPYAKIVRLFGAKHEIGNLIRGSSFLAFLCFKTCLIWISETIILLKLLDKTSAPSPMLPIPLFLHSYLLEFLWMKRQHKFTSTLSTLAHLYTTEKKLSIKFLLINSKILFSFTSSLVILTPVNC